MQVYSEYAYLENLCMDFTLLYAAKAVTKNPCSILRVLAVASLGASFAVVYPLFGIEGLGGAYAAVLGIAVKLLAGLIMCALCGRFSRLREYVAFTAVFIAFTFLLGGALIALFSLGGVSYGQGGGVMLTSVPIGVPMAFALVLIIIIKRTVKKFRAKVDTGTFICTVYVGDKSAKIAAFYDSGNKVYYSGCPVSIIPESAAKKIIETDCIKTFTDIHTVSGKGKVKVFKADKVEIDDGKDKKIKKGIFFGVAESRIKKIVMHPDVAR